MTNIIQTAERMIRDNTTSIGAICAEWNRINFEANTGLSFATPKTRKALVAKLEAAIIELNSRDSRMVDGIDDREFSGNSIAAAHDEAFKMDRERTANQLQGLAQRIVDGRAVYSTDKGRHFVQVDGKHLYEFNDEHDAVSYANRINGVQS